MTQKLGTWGCERHNHSLPVRVHLVNSASHDDQAVPLAGIQSTQSLPQSHFQMLHTPLVLCHPLQVSNNVYHYTARVNTPGKYKTS